MGLWHLFRALAVISVGGKYNDYLYMSPTLQYLTNTYICCAVHTQYYLHKVYKPVPIN